MVFTFNAALLPGVLAVARFLSTWIFPLKFSAFSNCSASVLKITINSSSTCSAENTSCGIISELFEFVSSNFEREFPDCPDRISTSWKFPVARPSVLSIVTISDAICPASTVMLTDSGITFNFGVASPTPEREISCGPFSALLVKTETDW